MNISAMQEERLRDIASMQPRPRGNARTARALHAAKPVATAWMREGVMGNAFPRPPRSAEEWAKYDADGYWKAKGYSEAPLYSAPPSPGEPAGGQPPKFYRMQDKIDRTHYVDYYTSVWELVIPGATSTKGEKP